MRLRVLAALPLIVRSGLVASSITPSIVRVVPGQEQQVAPMMPSAAWFAAYRVLRIAFVVHCIGLGSKFLWREFEADSNIFGTLLFDWGYSETTVQRVDDVGMWLMVVAGVATLLFGLLLKRQTLASSTFKHQRLIVPSAKTPLLALRVRRGLGATSGRKRDIPRW